MIRRQSCERRRGGLHDDSDGPVASFGPAVCKTANSNHADEVTDQTINPQSSTSDFVVRHPTENNEESTEEETANTDIEDAGSGQTDGEEEVDVLCQERNTDCAGAEHDECNGECALEIGAFKEFSPGG